MKTVMTKTVPFVLIMLFANIAFAKKTVYRKTQEVSFDGSDVDGVARTPDGAYLHQKKGVKFLPMYKVKDQLDKNIKDSVEYLR